MFKILKVPPEGLVLLGKWLSQRLLDQWNYQMMKYDLKQSLVGFV